jgi:hypothetical protein
MYLARLSSNGLSQQKNSDVDNVGQRDFNKSQINFISLEKEIAMGKQLAVQVEWSARSS